MSGIFAIPILGSLLGYLRSLFFSRHLEITVVGLQAAGKTSLLNLLALGQFSLQTVPTTGFGLKVIRQGGTTIKSWDLSGQGRYRPSWERYCRGSSAILFVVDSAVPLPTPEEVRALSGLAHSAQASGADDAGATGGKGGDDADQSGEAAAAAPAALNQWLVATEELHSLMEKPSLAGIPLLVLATKNDLPGAVKAEDVIRVMHLEDIGNREVSCYSISSKKQTNIDAVMRWLLARS